MDMDGNSIVTYGDDVLRMRAKEVEFNDETRQLIERMYVIMADARGLGLAAPQIGLSQRIFTYDVGEGPHALVNPVIVSTSGEESGYEGCLSIPGLQGEVTRAEKVTITGINEDGEKVKIKARGLLARVFQHEMDHLDGKMFIDRADPDSLETVPIDEGEEQQEE